MGLISKTFTLACALAGLAGASQLPEFTQQYRQRLAGAVEELRVVVADFDKDAANSGLSRQTALSQMIQSTEKFPRDRGASMSLTIDRFERLEAQQISMERAEPVSRPIFLFSTYDEKLLKGSWQIFEPAVPLNVPGAVWGGFGAFLLGFLARIPVSIAGFVRGGMQRRPRVKTTENVGNAVKNPAPQVEQKGFGESAKVSNSQSGHKPASPDGGFPAFGKNSLLDQITLEEQVVGEVRADGRLVKYPKKTVIRS